MQIKIDPDLEVWKPLLVEVDGFDGSKDSKKRGLFTADELLDEAELEAEQSNLSCPNSAAEDTYGGGGENEVRGRCEDGVEDVATAKRFFSGVDSG